MAKARMRNRVNDRRAVQILYGFREENKPTHIAGAVTYRNVQTVAQAVRRFFCEYREEQDDIEPIRVLPLGGVK